MPILDGTQFTRMVRNDVSLSNPGIPIIMVTSHTDQSHLSEARRAGIDGFVAKPFTPEIMGKHVTAVLAGKSLRTRSAPPKPVQDKNDLTALTCLVIDDSGFSRKLICSSLRDLGIRNVVQSADGVDGLSILREKFQPIGLILVEREMPIFDGLEFTRMVCRSQALKETHIPIGMVTGMDYKKHILHAKNAGVSAFVPKPVSTKDIEQQIRAAPKDPHSFIEAKRDGDS